jgi:hypothetical protein
MAEFDRIGGWSWELHAVCTEYRLPPSVVRRTWSLWDVHEAAMHIMIGRVVGVI